MHSSVRQFADRVAQVPSVLEVALKTALPAALPGPFALSGIGLSEHVARFAAVAWRDHFGLAARFQPATAFLSRGWPAKGTLVLFSQELSPNAQLVLEQATSFERVLLISSLAADDPRLAHLDVPRCAVWRLPPLSESGLLVRVLGPRVALLSALRLGEHLARLAAGSSASALAAPPRVAPPQSEGVALIASGWHGELLSTLSWQWMEALWTSPPPVWDVLQLAHGPWQQLRRAKGTTLVALRCADDPPAVWERFEATVSGRLPVIHVPAPVASPWAVFAHAATLDAWAVELLSATARDLTCWPAKGEDEPLYGLGRR